MAKRRQQEVPQVFDFIIIIIVHSIMFSSLYHIQVIFPSTSSHCPSVLLQIHTIIEAQPRYIHPILHLLLPLTATSPPTHVPACTAHHTGQWKPRPRQVGGVRGYQSTHVLFSISHNNVILSLCPLPFKSLVSI